MMCGTDPYPKEFKAKKYKLEKHAIAKEEFTFIMKNLPVPVLDTDIDEMFEFADKNKDGQLSFSEFELMINPPAPPEIARPHVTDLGMEPQVHQTPNTRHQTPDTRYQTPDTRHQTPDTRHHP